MVAIRLAEKLEIMERRYSILLARHTALRTEREESTALLIPGWLNGPEERRGGERGMSAERVWLVYQEGVISTIG